MKFINYAKYTDDADQVSAIRPRHLQYVIELIAAGKNLLAGPFADGSAALFVYEADDLAAATCIAGHDPYPIHGVFIGYILKTWDLRGVHPSILSSGSR